MLRTIVLFLLAAISEISGAYLVWQWARFGRSLAFALAGTGLLFGYAFTQTSQPFNFGRAFAAYGGVFITAALLWGWLIDGRVPDRWDWIGVGICLVGAAVILWMPRR
jgi:small multidrug resistance family-3 protein